MKKKGFTLIELLAVIVILAIIALIAVPVVVNIISDSKDESEKRSIDLYIDAVEKAIVKQNFKTKYDPDECVIQENSKLKCYKDFEEYPFELEIDIKGEKVTNGTLELENGKIKKIKYLTLGNNYYRYDDGKAYKTQKPPKEAGLYDDNYNLLASWDELVNKYHLDIAKGYAYNTYNNGTSGSMYNILNNNDKLKDGTILIVKNDVMNVGSYAFADCENLKTIVLSERISWIGKDAFSGCTNLSEINIPSHLTTIGELAFVHCENLKRIKIPNSVTNIGNFAFRYCNQLENIIIPDSVIFLGRLAFADCENLKSATIPGSIKDILESTFYNCKNLENVVIMNGVENIGSQVFWKCKKLKKISIPNTVISIGASVFFETGLTSITIPDSVTSISLGVFENCVSLTSVIFENTTGWFITSSSNTTSGISIDVTDASINATNLKETYKHKYWKRS